MNEFFSFYPKKFDKIKNQKSPVNGAKILFFSGGTALKQLSKKLIEHTHNSVHLITPFDSGGSSAKLRDAFNMIAVGDIRNRLMALADQSIYASPNIYNLFSMRYPHNKNLRLHKKLVTTAQGHHPLIKRIPQPMRQIICNNLQVFIKEMPIKFDLRGANIGNLILTGGYLHHNNQIDPVISTFSELVNVRGIVRPINENNLHIGAHLQNGKTILGQHLITGKESPPLTSPIKNLFITKTKNSTEIVEVEIQNKIKKLIEQTQLICYPMGSFYSSLIANLLIKRVAQTIAQNNCPKVLFLNSGNDPEQIGMSSLETIKTLIHYLEKDFPEKIAPTKLLNYVVLDSKNGNHASLDNIGSIQKLGIKIIDTDLSHKKNPYFDENKLIKVLLHLHSQHL